MSRVLFWYARSERIPSSRQPRQRTSLYSITAVLELGLPGDFHQMPSWCIPKVCNNEEVSAQLIFKRYERDEKVSFTIHQLIQMQVFSYHTGVQFDARRVTYNYIANTNKACPKINFVSSQERYEFNWNPNKSFPQHLFSSNMFLYWLIFIPWFVPSWFGQASLRWFGKLLSTSAILTLFPFSDNRPSLLP